MAIPICPWCKAVGEWEKDGNGRILVWACHSYKAKQGELKQSVECENNVLHCEIKRLQEELKLAYAAIVDAIATEDGMDGEDGLVVLRSIEAVMPSLKIEATETEGGE